MRVLLVNDNAPGAGAGAEVHLLRLARALEAAGDEVEIFAGLVRHLGAARVLDIWDPWARRLLRATAERFRPDIVHYHNFLRELSASVLGAVDGAARVLTVHDLRILGVPDGPVETPFDPWPIRRAKLMKAALERHVACRSMHATIAPSRTLAAMLKRSGFPAVHEVPHFTDPGPEPPTPPSASRRIAFAGRLSVEKGVHVLIEAFAAAAQLDPAARLAIAGDGPQLPVLRALAERLAPRRVEFLGLVDDHQVRDLFASCRAVAAPSLTRESSGLTVLEAAMAGRPTLVSDDPALRELVDEAGCGIVLRRGDPAALTEALGRLLTDPEAADRMGAAGRRVAALTRSTESGIAKTRHVYRTAAITPGSRAS